MSIDVRATLRDARNIAYALPWRAGAGLGLYHGRGAPVHYVTERADWAIRWVGDNMAREINARRPGTMEVTANPHRLARRVVHFGSQYMWLTWGARLHRSNRFVASFFHGKREDGPEVARHIDDFLRALPRLERVVTASRMVEDRLLGWGVPRDRLVRIPIGTDIRLFRPPAGSEREAVRARFGIPDDAVVLGSFQKDGVGWGDGAEPKRIKGPDILLALASRLRRDMNLWVFLSGPSRGFVKSGLEAAGVPFVHAYAADHAALAEFYHALDLYTVTSREEGGPMGLMEAMASGVPVISTRVGMAPDLIVPMETGALVDGEDVQGLADAAHAILALPDGASALKARARDAVAIADWSVVGPAHYADVYRPLIEQ